MLDRSFYIQIDPTRQIAERETLSFSISGKFPGMSVGTTAWILHMLIKMWQIYAIRREQNNQHRRAEGQTKLNIVLNDFNKNSELDFLTCHFGF